MYFLRGFFFFFFFSLFGLLRVLEGFEGGGKRRTTEKCLQSCFSSLHHFLCLFFLFPSRDLEGGKLPQDAGPRTSCFLCIVHAAISIVFRHYVCRTKLVKRRKSAGLTTLLFVVE
ncbi:unnamed protein product [Ixodes pacificus]